MKLFMLIAVWNRQSLDVSGESVVGVFMTRERAISEAKALILSGVKCPEYCDVVELETDCLNLQPAVVCHVVPAEYVFKWTPTAEVVLI